MIDIAIEGYEDINAVGANPDHTETIDDWNEYVQATKGSTFLRIYLKSYMKLTLECQRGVSSVSLSEAKYELPWLFVCFQTWAKIYVHCESITSLSVTHFTSNQDNRVSKEQDQRIQARQPQLIIISISSRTKTQRNNTGRRSLQPQSFSSLFSSSSPSYLLLLPRLLEQGRNPLPDLVCCSAQHAPCRWWWCQ
jgi:hypothetical protein